MHEASARCVHLSRLHVAQHLHVAELRKRVALFEQSLFETKFVGRPATPVEMERASLAHRNQFLDDRVEWPEACAVGNEDRLGTVALRMAMEPEIAERSLDPQHRLRYDRVKHTVYETARPLQAHMQFDNAVIAAAVCDRKTAPSAIFPDQVGQCTGHAATRRLGQ